GIREHMTLFVILIILGTCWVSHALGLSLALGALIAGMILSETEYNHQIILDILPLRDYFVGIFFISVGMLLNLNYFFDSILWFLGLTAGVIALKALMAMLATLILKNSFRISFIVGLRLAQVGEFSILLADQALQLGLFSEDLYQSFLIVSLLSMLTAPILIQLSVKTSIKLFSGLGAASESPVAGPEKKELTSHVIISGYGLGGRNLSRVLKEVHIDFLVLELNAERIKEALSHKIPAIYGDATHRDTLIRAGILQAQMIVISISDYAATEQSVRLARQLNPDLFIMVRTKYASQVEELNAAGADQVIPEEFETSIEIFSRVLKEYRVPNHIIEQQIELIRLEGYSMFRGYSLTAESLGKFSTYLTATLTESFQIQETSWARDKSLKEIELEKNTGTTLIAVVRNKEVQAKPPLEYQIKAGDSLILFGSHVQLAQSLKHLETGPKIL
ncbi:MAG: cation:proton antiporter, partial [Nitrospinales bacterium]